jgi:hypothetical protein
MTMGHQPAFVPTEPEHPLPAHLQRESVRHCARQQNEVAACQVGCRSTKPKDFDEL